MMNTTFYTVKNVKQQFLTEWAGPILGIWGLAAVMLVVFFGFNIPVLIAVVVMAGFHVLMLGVKSGQFTYDKVEAFTITDLAIVVDNKNYAIDSIVTLRKALTGYKGGKGYRDEKLSGLDNTLTVGIETGEIFAWKFVIETQEELDVLKAFIAKVKPKYA